MLTVIDEFTRECLALGLGHLRETPPQVPLRPLAVPPVDGPRAGSPDRRDPSWRRRTVEETEDLLSQFGLGGPFWSLR